MTQSDSISLCREQRVDVFGNDGRRRLIVDHPLNSPLVGVADHTAVVRASDLTLQPGDKTIVIYAAKAGGSHRVATAAAAKGSGGSVRLTDWRVEQGFEHDLAAMAGRTVHRVIKSN